VIVGEAANFVAYIYAPAVLVTPLGALSIIIRYLCHDHFALLCVCDLCDINPSFFFSFASAVLAHFLLKEKLKKMGVLGCVSCIVGSVVIVIHAPKEQTPNSVEEIWNLATQPGTSLSLFLTHTRCALSYL